MARAYYGSRISDNMTKTPEGYLICHNVPIARSGWYEYLGRDISPELEPEKVYNVYREPAEVFNPATLASFEGKTVTDGHVGGNGFINPNIEGSYHRGHAQNVHQGQGGDNDLLLADLIIKDANLISKIENKVIRDVSAGYSLDYVPYQDNPEKFSQTNIRGNHIAVVPCGRAGDRVAIMDEMSPQIKQRRSSPMNMMDLFTGWFKATGSDAKPEDVNAALALVNKAGETRMGLDQTIPALEALVGKVETLEKTINELVKSDREVHATISDSSMIQLDSLEAELSEKKEEAKEEKAQEEEPEKEAKDQETVNIVPVHELSGPELPQNPIPGADAAAVIRAAIKSIRPIIAAIPDKESRKQASDSLATELRKLRTPTAKQENVYGNILRYASSRGHDSSGEGRAMQDMELGKTIKEKYHRKNVVRQ